MPIPYQEPQTGLKMGPDGDIMGWGKAPYGPTISWVHGKDHRISWHFRLGECGEKVILIAPTVEALSIID